MMNTNASVYSASFCGCPSSAASFDARIMNSVMDTARILVVSICVLDVRLLTDL